MANPNKRDDLEWEQKLASISLAGVRPLVVDSVSVAASSEQTYTLVDKSVKRLVVLHVASGDTDIRFDLNATATLSSFPILPSVYFVVEAGTDDVAHFFNTSGGSITVYIMEIR